MEKYRVSFTMLDYFDYVGTDPFYSLKERVMRSLPYEFRKNLYNLKFKIVKNFTYKKWYRVHFSVLMEESDIQRVIHSYDDATWKLENVKCKKIKGCNRH